MEDGARLRRRLRRQADQLVARLGRVLRPLPRRPRRPAQAVLAAEPRPARAALVLDLALEVQRGPRLLQRGTRVPAAVLPALPGRLGRVARALAGDVTAGLARLAARGRD